VGKAPKCREEAERTASPSMANPRMRARCGVVQNAIDEAEARKGNASRRMNPRRARDAARGEIRRRQALIDRGMKPLKRGRCGSNASAPKALKHHRPGRDSSMTSLDYSMSTPYDGQFRGGAQAEASKQARVSVTAVGKPIARGEASPKGETISAR